MIAEELVLRGIEVASVVFVFFAVGRNLFSSRSGRERDPMRMSQRELVRYLVNERAGYGKHVLREIKLTRLAEPLIELRTECFRQNRPDLWLATFEQTMLALRAITERIDLYDQMERGMRKSDRRAIRKAIRADASALVSRVHEMLQASRPPLTQDIKNKLLGVQERTGGTLLGEPMRRRIAELSRSIEDALRTLPANDATSEASFTLRETLTRYLPDTLAAYAKLAAIDRATADAELEPQIRIIEESTRASIAALRDGRFTELATNGIFLRERLAAGQHVPPPTTPPGRTNNEPVHPDRTLLSQAFVFIENYVSRKTKPASRD